MSQETKTPRHPGEVASQIKEVVPVEQADALTQLDSIISSASFRAPEVQSDTWSELAFWVNTKVGKPPITEDWKIKAVAILTDDTEDTVREKYGVKS